MGFFSKIKKGIGKAAKKVGRGIKKTAKKVGKTVKKAAKGIGKAAKAAGKVGGKLGKGIYKIAKKGVAFGLKIVGNVALVPLIPYIPMMRKAVKKRGKAPNKSSITGLAKQFYKVVLKKQHYDCYDGDYFCYEDYEKNYVDPITIKALVALIMKYINSIKDKAASGEKLTKNEAEVLKMVKSGEKAVMEGATEVGEASIGKWINQNKLPIAIGLGSLLVTIFVIIGRSSKKSS